MKKFIVFTDLDGTLLDYSTYSFEPAIHALKLLREKDIPLVICSSKTKKEIEYYRKKLDNVHPFISENGGGIFIPKGYFDYELQIPAFTVSDEIDYQVIRLGAPYSELRKAITSLSEEGFYVKGFGDMTAEEIAAITGLSSHEAEMSKERYFDEPFVFEGNKEETLKLLNSIRAKGFNYTQGKFFHILGDSDKGKAVSVLIDLYKKKTGGIVTIAVGDGLNDIPMLEKVDYPVLVQSPDGSYEAGVNIPNLILACGVGPLGWNEAVLKLLKGHCSTHLGSGAAISP